jgi:hypothetical protein
MSQAQGGIIEYKLHKDKSWIGQGYNNEKEKQKHLQQLKADGYTIDKIVDFAEEEKKEQRKNYYDWLLN